MLAARGVHLGETLSGVRSLQEARSLGARATRQDLLAHLTASAAGTGWSAPAAFTAGGVVLLALGVGFALAAGGWTR